MDKQQPMMKNDGYDVLDKIRVLKRGEVNLEKI
jgi:hypothetical protein